jgi:lysophospholipase L1-like esterase
MLVQNRFPERHIQVINAAVPGFHTAEDIGNLALRVIPFKPDIVIIKHAHNDLFAIKPNTIFKPDYSHIHDKPFAYYSKPNFIIRFLNKSMFYVRLRNLWRKHKAKIKHYSDWVNLKKNMGLRIADIPDEVSAAFEQHMHALIAIARDAGAKVILTSFPTLYDLKSDWSKKETFDNLSDLQKGDLSAILYYISGLTLDGFFRGLDQYNSILKRLSEQENTGWVDSASLIPHEDKYFVDRIHFSKIGAQLMAENLLPVVLEMLKDK